MLSKITFSTFMDQSVLTPPFKVFLTDFLFSIKNQVPKAPVTG